MDAAVIGKRIGKVRQQLEDAGAEGLLVLGVENIRYLTGFSGHDSWLLVLGRSVILVTDSRYTEQAQGECIGCKIVQRKGSLSKEVAAILDRKRTVKKIGVEDSCSVGLLKTLRKELPVGVMPLKGIVENVRLIKTDEEIRLIRTAGTIAFEAMTWALGQLKAQMTERQLAALYEYRLSHHQAKPGFETIVCFGPNGSRNHHQPGERKLRKVDTVLCDFGASYRGYISDITRTFAFGKITPRFRNVYQAVARAQQAAIDAVREGVKLAEVDAVSREQIRRAGLPIYGHGTGHGVGLQVHESPFLSAHDKKGLLRAGQVVTIEPGIYLKGEFGVRLEDDVLVTQAGSRLLTRDERYLITPEHIPLLLAGRMPAVRKA